MNKQVYRWPLIFGWLGVMVLAYPLCQWLGPEWGWENGRLEWLQVFVLCGLTVFAVIQAIRSQKKPVRNFWIMMIPVMVFMVLRELTWGAVLFPPVEVGVNGPQFLSRKDLPYGAFVHPAVGIGMIGWWLVAFQSKFVVFCLELLKSKRIPWLEIGLALAAILLASAVERNVLHVPAHLHMVMEEYLETLFYAGIVLVFLRFNYYLSDNSVSLRYSKKKR